MSDPGNGGWGPKSPGTDLGVPFGLVDLPNGWRVGRFSALDGVKGIVAAVTTRLGPDVNAIKLDPEAAAGSLAEALHLEAVAWCRQVHGGDVLPVSSGGLAGECDGLVTDAAGLGLMVRGADCPLVLAVDPEGKAVGAAHASWRGVRGDVARGLVAAMRSHFGAQPGRIIACVSPSAGPCCYQVQADFLAEMAAGLGPQTAEFTVHRGGKTYFDLWSANRRQLLEAGLAPSNVHVAGVCTICNRELFPSHRAEGQAAGRFAAVVARDSR